jgi:hypothetical protein
MRVELASLSAGVVEEIFDARGVDLDRGGDFVDETRRGSVKVNAEHADRKLAVRLSVLYDRLRDDPDIVLAGDVKLVGS